MTSTVRNRRRQALGLAAALVALATAVSPRAVLASGPPPTEVNLSRYVRIGRYNLPEPTRTAPPVNSLLGQEASAVTYDWDTDTLFVVGDGGTSVVQVTKTGALINSMTLASGASPQGTDFYDTEGITYVGGGKFVLVEERDRQLSLFTYVAGGTLTRAGAQTVKLGTTIGNIGIEGVSFDPLTSGFVCVKEKDPQGVFQTGVDFAAGTATNGSPTTVNSVNLFDPALAGLLDVADVFALSNLPSLAGHPDEGHLLVLSQESGRILNLDRAGVVFSSLTIASDPGNPLSVEGQQHEGLTMDRDGALYVVSEHGGGDFDHPQLWVYAPSSAVNQAPTAITLNAATLSIVENTGTATRLKMADIAVTDDGLGANGLSVSGSDASFFEVDATGLYLKAGTVVDYESKSSYSVVVTVDDATVGTSPDASTPYNLTVIDVVDESSPGVRLIVSEVAPWSSGNSPIAADWFEVTNVGSAAADVTGWRMDDNSNSFALSVPLAGVASISPGQSVIFIESATATTVALFKSTWFGTHVPAGLTIGTYGGSGVGLSTGGDAVNLFDGSGNRITGVAFGASTVPPVLRTFDNAAGLGTTTLPLPVLATLGTVGTNGAFNAVAPVAGASETGSPGRIANHAPVANAGPDQTAVEAVDSSGASVTVSGTASFDADGDFLTYAWTEGGSALSDQVGLTGTLGIGSHTLTLTVSDPFGGGSSDTVAVTVQDTTAPAISGTPDGITVEATSPAGAAVSFAPPTAFDLVDGVVAVVCARPSGSTFPLGTTLNACTATDAHGNRSTSSFRVTVRDTTAPAIARITATPAVLWPANHKLVGVTLAVTATDAGDANPVCRILAVTLNETAKGHDDRDDKDGAKKRDDDRDDVDWVITGPLTLKLRAERSEKSKTGRVYTISVRCTDASGNSSDGTVTVTVPREVEENKEGKDDDKKGDDKKGDKKDK